MDLAQHLLQQFIVDTHHIPGRGLNQTLRGYLVNLPRNAPGVVMDDHLGGVIEDLRAATCLLHLVVDVLPGMVFAEGPQLVANADAIGQSRDVERA